VERVFSKLHDRVIKYGTIKNINNDTDVIRIKKKPWIVFLPDDPFKRFWNLLVIVLLIYVVTYVPVGVCFFNTNEDDRMNAGAIVDLIVDFLFVIDIFVNFLSAY